MLDILIVLVIGALVASRFFAFKLPTDNRDKPSRRADFERMFGRVLGRDDEAVGPLKDVTREGQTVVVDEVPAGRRRGKKEMPAGGQEGALGVLLTADPHFDEKRFLDGAVGAYGYFYECWNGKDTEGMDFLCAPRLLNRVLARWQVQEGPGAWEPVTVDSVERTAIAGARVNGRTMIVEVDFTAVQREGDGVPKKVNSRWVLARAAGSDDPNWELQDMTTGVDA